MALNQRLRLLEDELTEPLEDEEDRDVRDLREDDPATGPTNGEEPPTSTGTFEDLLREDTFDDRRGTLEVSKSDVPIEVEGLPIPFPWQGIQRAAIVFNLGFVYDESEGRWVRQKKSSLREASLVDSGSVTLAASGGSTFEGLGLTDPNLGPDQLLERVMLAEDPGTNVVFQNDANDADAGAVSYGLRWNDAGTEWELAIINQVATALDLDWRVDRIPGP